MEAAPVVEIHVREGKAKHRPKAGRYCPPVSSRSPQPWWFARCQRSALILAAPKLIARSSGGQNGGEVYYCLGFHARSCVCWRYSVDSTHARSEVRDQPIPPRRRALPTLASSGRLGEASQFSQNPVSNGMSVFPLALSTLACMLTFYPAGANAMGCHSWRRG